MNAGSQVARLLALGPVAALKLLRDQPAGMRLGRVQLGSGGSAIEVTDSRSQEWVLHWPLHTESRCWPWPLDPDLPSLAQLRSSDVEFLAATGWSPELWSGPVTLSRLGYKPQRRATFRLDSGSRSYILKVVCPNDFDVAVCAARYAGNVQAGAPRLVANCAALGALLLEFLPGTPLDRMLPAGRRAPLAVLPHTLAALHTGLANDETFADALPTWSADHVRRKLDALIELTDPVAPALAETARGAAADIFGELATWQAGATGAERLVVHGDLSLRNLVHGQLGRLSVIDWDSAAIGPPEADLSPLVGLLGAETRWLVGGYESASGRRLDRRRLSALVQANRLTRTLRRVATGRDTPEAAILRLA